MPAITALAAWEIAESIRGRKLSPVEVMEAHLSAIERLNPKLNAFAQIDATRARAAAQAAETAVMRGEEFGILHGVPVTIKSSIDVAGLLNECGSRTRAGIRATSDAPLVARLKRAGAIILGTTNVPEMLMAWETDNLVYGRTNSPFDLQRTPGGSSGGEAAAIAAGLSAGGIGSDGGGSIRVPAHFCGICGLKPTPGRIPITGHFPESGGPFVQLGVVGPMARTVRDLELMLRATAGPDWGDVRSLPLATADWKSGLAESTTVGWFDDNGIAPATAETRQAVRQAAEVLRLDGFAVETFQPKGVEGFFDLFQLFFCQCSLAVLQPMADAAGDDLSPLLRDYLKMVSAAPRPDFSALLMGWIERDRMRVRLMRQMERFPILLSPVAAIPAFRHGERRWRIDGRDVDYLAAFSYSQFCNVLGLPAAVTPVARSPEGLPIAVQVIGRPFEEERVLAVAARIEACTREDRHGMDFDSRAGSG